MMTEPGVYTCTSRGKLQLGRFTNGDPEPVARLLDPVTPTTVTADLTAVRWSKLAINCATSTVGAIGGERLGRLLMKIDVRRLVLELWAEVVAVARASGIKMAPVAGTLDIERILTLPAVVQHALLVSVGMKYRRQRSSMLIALERGRKPEIDFLNGEIVRRGAASGIPTPVNARLVELVGQIAAGKLRSSVSLLAEAREQRRGMAA
jgi:2-dehydropantoate 2-reductase